MKEVISNLVAWALIALANLTSWLIVDIHHDLMSAAIGFAYVQFVSATLFVMMLIALYGVMSNYKTMRVLKNSVVKLTEVWFVKGQPHKRVTYHDSWESMNYRLDLTQALWPEGTEFSVNLDDDGNVIMIIHG